MQTAACPTCGATVRAGIQFCQQCGADVRAAQEAADTLDVVPPPLRQGDLMDLLSQATQGEFLIHGELGRGGMATVFLADDLALDRKVAIKVMAKAVLTGADVAERFKREARTVGGLSHPHVIPIYAVRETAHLLFFVMKYVEGRGLDQILKEFGPLPIKMVQAIVSQVGSALQHAHRRGIVHRDVKPGNIMLDDDGWAVVTDFGIAKVAQQVELTKTGSTVGTPYYMSPEQCSGTSVTPASDQYSLGIVAYEMLTGRVPFRGASIMDIMRGHFMEAPPPIGEFRRDCPGSLAGIVMRMLAKEAEERFPSIDDMITAIDLAPLAADDPTRTQMVELARSGSRSRPSIPAVRPPLPRPRTTTALQNARVPARPRPVSGATPSPRPTWNAVLLGIGALAFVGVGWGLSLLLVHPADRSPPDGSLAEASRRDQPAPANGPGALGARPTVDSAKPPPLPAVVDSPALRAGAPPETSATAAAPVAHAVRPASTPRKTPASVPAPEPEGDPGELIARMRERASAQNAAPPRAPAPAATTRPEPAVPPVAWIRISTKSPNARLYISGQEYPLGDALQEFQVRPGIIQLRIIADGCDPEDKVDTLRPGQHKTIGRFNARCP